MILVYAGVQADLPGRSERRLPPEAQDRLSLRIRWLLRSSPPRLVMGALASGSDIIVAEAALAEAVPVRVVLPFDVPTFETRSLLVHGAGWVARFHTVLAATGPPAIGRMDPEDPGVFSRHNLTLVRRAVASAAALEAVEALVIRPQGHGSGGVTDDFVDRCRDLSVPVHGIDPGAPGTGGPAGSASISAGAADRRQEMGRSNTGRKTCPP